MHGPGSPTLSLSLLPCGICLILFPLWSGFSLPLGSRAKDASKHFLRSNISDLHILNPQERESDLFPLGLTAMVREQGCLFSEKVGFGWQGRPLEVMPEGSGEVSDSRYCRDPRFGDRGAERSFFLLSYSAVYSNAWASTFIILLWSY